MKKCGLRCRLVAMLALRNHSTNITGTSPDQPSISTAMLSVEVSRLWPTSSLDGFSKPRTLSRTRSARDGSATSASHSRASCLEGKR